MKSTYIPIEGCFPNAADYETRDLQINEYSLVVGKSRKFERETNALQNRMYNSMKYLQEETRGDMFSVTDSDVNVFRPRGMVDVIDLTGDD